MDSLAALMFSTAVATLSERLIAGMDWGQVAVSRAVAAPVMLLTGRGPAGCGATRPSDASAPRGGGRRAGRRSTSRPS